MRKFATRKYAPRKFTVRRLAGTAGAATTVIAEYFLRIVGTSRRLLRLRGTGTK